MVVRPSGEIWFMINANEVRVGIRHHRGAFFFLLECTAGWEAQLAFCSPADLHGKGWQGG